MSQPSTRAQKILVLDDDARIRDLLLGDEIAPLALEPPPP
jgi:hypothetical protein